MGITVYSFHGYCRIYIINRSSLIESLARWLDQEMPDLCRMPGLMDKILHYLKDPKLWELWYIPYYGSCRILSINRRVKGLFCMA